MERKGGLDCNTSNPGKLATWGVKRETPRRQPMVRTGRQSFRAQSHHKGWSLLRLGRTGAAHRGFFPLKNQNGQGFWNHHWESAFLILVY